jgi:hypothetical protein
MHPSELESSANGRQMARLDTLAAEASSSRAEKNFVSAFAELIEHAQPGSTGAIDRF